VVKNQSIIDNFYSRFTYENNVPIKEEKLSTGSTTIKDKKSLDGLDSIQQLEHELQGNTFALKELQQLQYLFDYDKELEKQKQLAEHLAKIGELCSSLTHNLRDPLGVISFTVKIIESTLKDSLDEKTLSGLSRITNSTKNMYCQIEDVLNFVRNKPLDLQIISFSKMLQSTINNIEIPD